MRLARDVYDLAQFATRTFNEASVRRLWILKTWGDIVDDHRGTAPIEPSDVLTPRSPTEFRPESIGVLTRPIDIAGWETATRQRFAFLANLDEDEQRWARCNPRDRREIQHALTSFGD